MKNLRNTGGLLAAAFFAALLPFQAAAITVDLSPQQPGRVRAEKVPDAIAKISKDYKLVNPGKLTIASVPGRLPFATYGSDTKTPVGAEPDLAQLVADSLGLELQLVPVAWADWPLGVASGKYDAVVHNVTVTEERKEKFDFSTYRNDLLGFYVPTASKITAITKPEDVAGLKVIVSAGTNQETILVRWVADNKAKGLADTEIQYYDDDVVLNLALQSGRADA